MDLRDIWSFLCLNYFTFGHIFLEIIICFETLLFWLCLSLQCIMQLKKLWTVDSKCDAHYETLNIHRDNFKIKFILNVHIYTITKKCCNSFCYLDHYKQIEFLVFWIKIRVACVCLGIISSALGEPRSQCELSKENML